MGAVKFFDLMGVELTGFDPERRFFTSWLLPPLGLAIYRLLFALFGWTNLIANWIYNGIYDPSDNRSEWSYFTTLTFWGLTTYMTIAAIHTFVYAKKGYTWLDHWGRSLQALHSLFYTTIIVYPFIVTIVYWGLLYSSPWFPVTMDAYRNISRHALNSLMALLEIILPTTNTPPWLHIVFLILILAAYLGLAYVTYATQGFYTYAFLDPNKGAGHLAGYVVGIAAACVVVFLLVWGLIWVRRRVTDFGKKSRRDVSSVLYRTQDIEMSRK